MDYFDRLANKIKSRVKNIITRLKFYFKRLLFPIYLFPIKLLTYSIFYLLKFVVKLIFAFFGLIIDCIIYPFRSLKNFLKSIVFSVLVLYVFISLVVIADYVRENYGHYSKFLCGLGMQEEITNKVVRIVGGYAEGSGFFINDFQVVTSFHVIADEPSPKVIFPNGKFVTPDKIIGNPNTDIAILFLPENYPDYTFPIMERVKFYPDEQLLSVGYPLGTELNGKATIQKGRFIDFRQSRKQVEVYIQTDINLVEGMSGGPLLEKCGKVVGVNTMGLSGLSMFVSADTLIRMMPYYTDQNITKIQVDPSKSPESSVYAFYTFLKARRMQDGFNLLSKEYLQKTNFQEWTGRFTDILDVDVIKSEKYESSKDTAFVKFSTKNWVDGEAEMHYYEGTWKTVKEDGVYKMLKSNIKEVQNPGMDWFYE